MPLSSGLNAQIGYATESVYGTGVTATRFLPLVDESLTAERERLESEGVIAGERVLLSQSWNGGNISVSGDVGHELYDRGLGLLFTHMFGGVATTGVGPYTHTFTPGDLSGKSMTVQVGRPSVAGVVHPFTYAGCKVASWELACSAGEIATLGLSLVGKSETTATALAAATYPTGIKPLKFNHGTVTTVGGTAVKVMEVSITGDNGLKDDRRYLGDQLIGEPLEESLREYAGSIKVEFENLTHYTSFINGTEQALALGFTAGANSVTISGNVRFDGASPEVGGREVLMQDIPIKFIKPTGSQAITAVLVNSDVTP